MLPSPDSGFFRSTTSVRRPRTGAGWLRSPLALAALMLGASAGAQSSDPAEPAASEPLVLHAAPLLQDKRPADQPRPLFIAGQRITGQPDLRANIEGDAELRQPGLTVRGDELHYDQTTDTVRGEGSLLVNRAGNVYRGSAAELRNTASEGFVLQPSYRFLANGAHGEAVRIDFLDPNRTIIRQGTYSTCRRDSPDATLDWILRADRIRIDQESDEGVAEGARLEFFGAPILPLPELSFPLSERRKSGLLPPTIGLDSVSGLNLAVPYYWNIAPNRDATIEPILMSKRGLDLFGQFRYMESNYQGRVEGSLMPTDQLRERARWSLFTRHNGSYPTGLDTGGPLNLSLNINRVSDDNFWHDFPHQMPTLMNRLLPTDAAMSWSSGDLTLRAVAQKWQVLQDVTAPIVPPYDRLPQLVARWGRDNDRGFDYWIDADHTHFRAQPLVNLQPDGQRSFVNMQLARPWLRPWGFLIPKLQLHATHYGFDTPLADGSNRASRVLPTASLDGGLLFERDTSYFRRSFVQTLEPRIKYVRTPYQDQSLLPNYDTGAYDFNFATIFSENAFAGNDRIVDNNLVTFGLTSRLLDPDSGAEALRLGIAQRYRFEPQRVTLPGGTVAPQGWSDIMLGASVSWNPHWSVDSLAQYNAKLGQSVRTTLGMRYMPSNYRTLSVAYRRQSDLNTRQLDLGWQWPLNDLWGDRGQDLGRGRGQGPNRWYTVGRLNYDAQARQLVDAVIGLEYDGCCWVGRVVLEKLNSTSTSSTKRIMFQLEFVGLSRLGSSPLRTLRNYVPNYQFLREPQPAPSRFTNYD